MDDELKNGEVWKQPKFPCFAGFVQWVSADEWMFMAIPEAGRCGWLVSIPTTGSTGKLLLTGQELLQRLRSMEYEPQGHGIEASQRS